MPNFTGRRCHPLVKVRLDDLRLPLVTAGFATSLDAESAYIRRCMHRTWRLAATASAGSVCELPRRIDLIQSAAESLESQRRNWWGMLALIATTAVASNLVGLIGPAFAEGGAGFGGIQGGIDSATGPGSAGGDGSATRDSGGGGGAGAIGGRGGFHPGGFGEGAGGAFPGAAGGTGDSNSLSGGGGGGGAHGGVRQVLAGANITGGAGGLGGPPWRALFNGGGGGAAGWGLVVTGDGNLGALGASATGGNGGNGGSLVSNNISGGGGGSGGIGLAFTGNSITGTISAPVRGGDAGAGGKGWFLWDLQGTYGKGGNGGTGGAGISFLGSGASSITVGASVSGGKGGDGGATGAMTAVSYRTDGGAGGAGGAGLLASNVVINISAGTALTGGNGGAGGAAPNTSDGSGVDGPAGNGGAGIVGSNLTIISAGDISGGLDGGASARANAITLMDGIITVTLLPGWSMRGDVHLTTAGTGVQFDQSTAATLGNVVTGAGSLTKLGADGLTLSGANTYTGVTTVSAGTLTVSNGSGLGGGAGGTTVASGATLALTGGITVGAEALTLSGTGALGAGALTSLNSGVNTFQGAITLAAASSITVQTTSSLNLSGGISGFNTDLTLGGSSNNSGTISGVIAIGSGSITKVGSLWTLAGANTYSGLTTVVSGSLFVTNSLGLGATASGTVVASGASLSLGSGVNIGGEALTLSGTGMGGFGALLANGGTSSYGGDITLAADSQINAGFLNLPGVLAISGGITGSGQNLTLAGPGTGTVSGVIATGTGGLTKINAGTWSLSGANTYTGATQVNGGELRVNGSLASSAVGVASGATLSGSGVIVGAVTVASGGTLSAGNSPGTLTVGSLTLSSGSNTVFELNSYGVVGGPDNDRIIVNGSGAAGNLTLGGTLTANVASAGYYRLFEVTGGGTISGSFDTLALAAPSVAGAVGTIYNAPSGVPNQVNLAVVGAGQTMQFWDGTDLTGNGTVDGGSGIWNGGNANWTGAPGHAGINAPWLGSVGVFQGTAGAVTVPGTQSFDTLQFNSDGYVLTGGSLGLGVTGGGTINTASGVTVSIGSAIVDGVGTSLTKVGAGTLILTGTNTYSGGTTIGGGTLRAGSASAIGVGPLTLAGGTFQAGTGFINTFATAIAVDTSGGAIDANGQVVTLTGNITDGNGAGGVLSLLNSSTDIGRVDLGGSNSYSGPTAIGGGVTLAAAANGAFSPNSDVTLAPNAALMAHGHAVTVRSLAGSGLVVNGHDTQAGSLTLAVSSGTASFVGSIADDAPGETGATLALAKTGAGTQILAGANSYTGGTTILGGTLQIGAGGTSGSITGDVANGGTLVFNRSDAVSFGGAVSGSGALRQAGTGTTTLTGISSYTGATFVDAGALVVNGSIAASSGMTVAAGGAVGGTGALPSLTVNGTLSPGNSPGTLTVNGNLVMGTGSTYVAEVQGAVSDRTAVTGTAALAGTLRIVPLGGAYSFSAPYTLLSTAGGLGGTRFGLVDTTGSFGDGVTTAVSYNGNDVQLTLTPKPLAPIVDPVVPPIVPSAPSPRLGVGRPANALAVASAIDAAVANGADPSGLFGIYNLPAAAIPVAVNQLSGEVHTAVPAMANSAAGQFLGTMLDGSGAGRLAGSQNGPGGAAGFTADLPSKQGRAGSPDLGSGAFLALGRDLQLDWTQ
ncbi:autotransporter-associated beta strand repeat-containing protein [Bosea sp. Tri-44]|uniref:beta strand repeat-containing protein n=1 Tax=Bosea sp. Tri-44 TaxID=1972137 RepID=UPI0013E9408D|nr:autotransporter-associated beta strand repeat-containing protein [Bosea sp. Tri-44]